MATNKVKPKTSGGETPATKKVSPKKAAPKEAMADRRTAHAKAQPAPKADKTVSPDKDAPFNAETAQVLRDADAGKDLLHYPSLEAMFEDLARVYRVFSNPMFSCNCLSSCCIIPYGNDNSLQNGQIV